MGDAIPLYPTTPGNPHAVPEESPASDLPAPLDPLVEVAPPRRRTAAEEAQTILAAANTGTLATLTAEGDPWASVVSYGVVGGTPVLCLSSLALHGRNVAADRRASLAVSEEVPEGRDPGDCGRVTLAGCVEQPGEDELEPAKAAYRDAVPSAAVFSGFGDFTFWLLRVQRVRWVGGFGRMASASGTDFLASSPDPVAGHSAFAVRHMNEDHADALLEMARAIAGHTDATAASCVRADRYGLDLAVETPRGPTSARVGFAEPIVAPDGLRAATVELARRARAR